jgi:hypothetical protein
MALSRPASASSDRQGMILQTNTVNTHFSKILSRKTPVMAPLLRRLSLSILALPWFLSPSSGHAAAAVCSTTTTASLKGWYGMSVFGSGSSKYLVGALSFDGAGNITANNVYDQNNVDNTIAKGSYGVNADCTVSISFALTPQGTSTPSATQTYTVGVKKTSNEAVGIETDGSAVATIDLQAQYASSTTGPSYTSISSLNGTSAASCFGSSNKSSDLNLQTFSNGTVTGTDPFNNDAGLTVTSFTGTYSVNTDGTFVGVATVYQSPYTLYGVVSNSGKKVAYFYNGGAKGNNLDNGGLEACTGQAVVSLGAAGTAPSASVNLGSVATEAVIAANGTGASGMGNSGYSYSANLLGTSVAWNGLSFPLGSAGAKSAVTSTTIPLPAGSFNTLSFLGTGLYGNQLNQSFVVNYSDGSSTTFTQSMSDWGGAKNYGASSATYPGETIVSTMAYRVTPSGATQNGPWYLYGYSFAINPAKTAVSLTLPKNGDVLVLSVELSNAPVTVSLSSVANETALANNGKGAGGLSNSGYSFSANLLGPTVSWAGPTFTLGSAGALDAVSGKTVTLPAGSFNTLSVLATAAYGDQLNQVFTVTYTNGTTQTFTQSMSDWGGATNYGASSATFLGESVAATMAYRVTPSGATQNGPWYVYGYSFPINPALTVQSLTLPANGDVVVLGVELSNQ